MDKRVRGALKDCEATSEIHLDSDHKAVKMRVDVDGIGKRRPTKRKKQDKTKNVCWPPRCIDSYKADLTHRLNGFSTDAETLSCENIEMAITESMAQCEQPMEQTSKPVSENLQTLLEQRRTTPSSAQEARRRLTKQIRKEIRETKRTERRSKIGKILQGYKNLKAISGIKSQRKKELIPCMVSKSGAEVHERQGIADTFAEFYAELYRDAGRAPNTYSCEIQTGIESFTWEEMETAIKILKKGKAPDSAHICAEMIKYGGEKVQHSTLNFQQHHTNGNADTGNLEENNHKGITQKWGLKVTAKLQTDCFDSNIVQTFFKATVQSIGEDFRSATTHGSGRLQKREKHSRSLIHNRDGAGDRRRMEVSDLDGGNRLQKGFRLSDP